MTSSAEQLFCNRCGDQNPADSRFCESCGDPFDSLICSCGAELVPRARFCHMCGISLSNVSSSSPAEIEELSVATESSQTNEPSESVKQNVTEDTLQSVPRSAPRSLQSDQTKEQLQTLHKNLLEVHHKAAKALEEEKKQRATFEKSYQQAQAFREQAMAKMRNGDENGAKEALEQQLVYERSAAESRAHLELAQAACEPLRDQLFALHNEFLESIDFSLGVFAEEQAWSQAEELFQEILPKELSNSRRARILYAIGMINRDGLQETERARQSFKEAFSLDAKFIRAKDALETL